MCDRTCENSYVRPHVREFICATARARIHMCDRVCDVLPYMCHITHRTYEHIMRLITATHCNTLQHTATHCNTLQHTATHCNTLQHTARQVLICAMWLMCSSYPWDKNEGSNERVSSRLNLYQLPLDLYGRSLFSTAPPGAVLI